MYLCLSICFFYEIGSRAGLRAEHVLHLEAIDTLVELMRNGKDERVRGTAAQGLLDRGWCKAKVEVVTGAEGSYLDVLRVVNERHACQAQ